MLTERGTVRDHSGALVASERRKQRGQLASFLDRVPAVEAPEIIRVYVASNRGLYVSATHCVDLLLRDAEAHRLAWQTGRSVTETAARQADRRQGTVNAFAPLLAEAKAREGDKT